MEREMLREQAIQLIFSEGRTSREKREGLRLLFRACDAGDPEAMCIVGKMLLEGRFTMKKGNGIETAVNLLCRAAKAGWLPARTILLRFRNARYRQTRQNDRPENGPLTGFDGKEIHIDRTGLMTPVDAVLTYEDGMNVLTLSLNLGFIEDENCIPDVDALHQAVVRGIMSWAGEYTVFGGQRLRVDIRITAEPRLFDNVLVLSCNGDIAEMMQDMWSRVGTRHAKDNLKALFQQNRAMALTGLKKWSVRTRKIICLQTSSGRFDEYEEIARITRHEFGHVLGLGDMYAEPERGLDGIPAGTWPELDAYAVDGRAYNLVMHHSSGTISDNDLEMVVLAFSKNRPQVYQPDRYVKIVSEALGKGN